MKGFLFVVVMAWSSVAAADRGFVGGDRYRAGMYAQGRLAQQGQIPDVTRLPKFSHAQSSSDDEQDRKRETSVSILAGRLAARWSPAAVRNARARRD